MILERVGAGGDTLAGTASGGFAGDLGCQTGPVAGDQVAALVREDFLVLQIFMPPENEEGRRVFAHPCVGEHGKLDLLGAARAGALADEALRLSLHLPAGGLLGDPLVHLPKQRLISCLPPDPRHGLTPLSSTNHRPPQQNVVTLAGGLSRKSSRRRSEDRSAKLLGSDPHEGRSSSVAPSRRTSITPFQGSWPNTGAGE